jgi:hypothetical protein
VRRTLKDVVESDVLQGRRPTPGPALDAAVDLHPLGPANVNGGGVRGGSFRPSGHLPSICEVK